MIEVGIDLSPDAEDGMLPRPAMTQRATPLAEREGAKAAELTGLGQVVAKTVARHRGKYGGGVVGLVDQRSGKSASSTGRVDEQVITASRQAPGGQVCTSIGRRTRVRFRLEQMLAEQHAARMRRSTRRVVAMPAATPFERLLDGLDTGGHSLEFRLAMR